MNLTLSKLQERHTESSLILEISSVDLLCIGIRKEVTGYHSLAMSFDELRNSANFKTKAMQIQMYA